MLCKVATTSHLDLQETLLDLNRSGSVVRSTSVVVLSTVVAPRTLPLLASTASGGSSHSTYTTYPATKAGWRVLQR